MSEEKDTGHACTVDHCSGRHPDILRLNASRKLTAARETEQSASKKAERNIAARMIFQLGDEVDAGMSRCVTAVRRGASGTSGDDELLSGKTEHTGC